MLGLFQSRPVAAKTIEQVDGKLIEQLIEQRNSARKQKDFATADSIRHNLSHMGVSLEDLPSGKTIWHEKQQSMEAEGT